MHLSCFHRYSLWWCALSCCYSSSHLCQTPTKIWNTKHICANVHAHALQHYSFETVVSHWMSFNARLKAFTNHFTVIYDFSIKPQCVEFYSLFVNVALNCFINSCGQRVLQMFGVFSWDFSVYIGSLISFSRPPFLMPSKLHNTLIFIRCN
jgi:hypothetical protein